MPKVSELTGTPWHVEKLTRNEGDERRHKSRCIYYRKKDAYCKYQYIECAGSRYCKYYKAKEIEDNNKNSDAPIKKTEVPRKITDAEGKKIYPVGSKVHHKKFGYGYIKDISKGHIVIDFEDAGEKILGLDICVTRGYLDIVEKAVIAESVAREERKVVTIGENTMLKPHSAEQCMTKKKFGWLGKLFSGLFKLRKNG